MVNLFVLELTLAFVVSCADSVDRETDRTPLQRLVRAFYWPVPVARWFTRRNTAALSRFGAVVWFLVTTGWLLSLEYDRLHPTPLFLAVAETTMAFVVYSVDAMSADLHNHWRRRAARSAFWIKPVIGFLRDPESVKLVHASVTVWVLLITGWLLGLVNDRIVIPLGGEW